MQCHRPPEYVGRSVIWFCDAFVQFHHDLKSTQQIPRKYYDIALNLCEEMSKTYFDTNGRHEDARIKAFDNCFLDLSSSTQLYHIFKSGFQEIVLSNN